MIDSWIVYSKRNPSAQMRLFCVPYAGGGVPVYARWLEGLPPSVEVAIVQPPGRGARLTEAPFTQLLPLVEALAVAIKSHLEKPCALFGHSVGAVIAFELARTLHRGGGPFPIHLFVSGRVAPHLPDRNQPLRDLPDAEFVREVNRLGGIPAEVMANSELMSLLLPTLRADIAVSETYAYAPDGALACPITALGGTDDGRVSGDRVDAWRYHTTAAFARHMIPGDHFFLNTPDGRLRVLEIVSRALAVGAFN